MNKVANRVINYPRRSAAWRQDTRMLFSGGRILVAAVGAVVLAVVAVFILRSVWWDTAVNEEPITPPTATTAALTSEPETPSAEPNPAGNPDGSTGGDPAGNPSGGKPAGIPLAEPGGDPSGGNQAGALGGKPAGIPPAGPDRSDGSVHRNVEADPADAGHRHGRRRTPPGGGW